ncbi:MAG: peptide-methionine (R)-S-oxide reductase MsrB [Sphingobium sp.]
MTRRELLGMGAVGVVAVAIAGKVALSGAPAKAPPGHFPVQHGEAEWRARLSPASYKVLREAATENRYSSLLLNEHRAGIFSCGGCDNALFSSTTKYDSRTGWPSFWQVLPGAVATRSDLTLGRQRTEVLCADCGGHLGHLFDDGPKPTGLRYCMNGVAMTFKAGKTA